MRSKMWFLCRLLLGDASFQAAPSEAKIWAASSRGLGSRSRRACGGCHTRCGVHLLSLAVREAGRDGAGRTRGGFLSSKIPREVLQTRRAGPPKRRRSWDSSEASQGSPLSLTGFHLPSRHFSIMSRYRRVRKTASATRPRLCVSHCWPGLFVFALFWLRYQIHHSATHSCTWGIHPQKGIV